VGLCGGGNQAPFLSKEDAMTYKQGWILGPLMMTAFCWAQNQTPPNAPPEKPYGAAPVTDTPPKTTDKPARIRVGGGVYAATLIKQPKPVYPPKAKKAHITGLVRFSALIGKDGSVQKLTLVSGHPMLVPAAMKAVKKWRYKPTTVDGEAVEVATVIDVNFTLNQ
jgi:TonB family protein